jgi:hypothetical protein
VPPDGGCSALTIEPGHGGLSVGTGAIGSTVVLIGACIPDGTELTFAGGTSALPMSAPYTNVFGDMEARYTVPSGTTTGVVTAVDGTTSIPITVPPSLTISSAPLPTITGASPTTLALGSVITVTGSDIYMLDLELDGEGPFLATTSRSDTQVSFTVGGTNVVPATYALLYRDGNTQWGTLSGATITVQ